MASSALLLLALWLPQQPAPPATTAVPADAELLLVPGAITLSPTDLGLGHGGVRPAGGAATPLRALPSSGTTPGGVEVRALPQGVRIAFPSGRQLLFAPDGFLHLRGGEHAGPFPGGVELHLADGCSVRIVRTGSRRNPLQEVLIAAAPGGAARGGSVRIWQRDRPALEWDPPRSDWPGTTLLCAGDGDAVYRVVAAGPMLILERVAVPAADARTLPERRVVLRTDQLLTSLRELPASIGQVDGALAAALQRAEALARGTRPVFPAEATAPRRVERQPARFALGAGCELTLSAEHSGPVRMGLHRGQESDPFVEWSLGYVCQLNLLHPERADGGSGRYWRGGVTLPVTSLPARARPERFDLDQIQRVIRGLAP